MLFFWLIPLLLVLIALVFLFYKAVNRSGASGPGERGGSGSRFEREGRGPPERD